MNNNLDELKPDAGKTETEETCGDSEKAKTEDGVDRDFGFGQEKTEIPVIDKKCGMNNSRKIAYSATAAAIGIAALAVAFFVPSSIPYIIAGVCLYIATYKCGYKYGILTYIAVAGAGLIINIVSALPFVFMFGLHPLISFTAAKLKDKIKNNYLYWTIRVLIIAVFFNAAFLGLYYLATTTMFDLVKIQEILGGYIVMALIGTVFFTLYDVAAMIVTGYILKIIK